MRLNNLQCKNAKPQAKSYKLPDGGGLYLEVKASGSKIWRYRFKLAGKESTFTLGTYCERAPIGESESDTRTRVSGGMLTLAEARAEMTKAKALVRQGTSPVTQRQTERKIQQAENRTSFSGVANEWLALQTWAENTKRLRLSTLQRLVLPEIGHLPVKQITPHLILPILQRAAKTNGSSVAKLVRQMLYQIFEYAAETFRVESNPVHRWRSALPRHESQSKSPLTPPQIGQLLRDLRAYGGSIETKSALRFMWLTLCRPTEAVGAMWREMDLEQGIWRIPPERMKMRREHTTALSVQAVALLREIHRINGRTPYVFPCRGRADKGMSTVAVRNMLSSIGWRDRFSPHATRVSGSTILNEMGFPPDWIERQLAHQDSNAVRRTYNHAKHEEGRAQMMQQWADLLDAWEAGEANKVIPFPSASRAA